MSETTKKIFYRYLNGGSAHHRTSLPTEVKNGAMKKKQP
jgi:hypothetical protein